MSSNPAGEGRRPWSLALRLTAWYAAAAFALVIAATGLLYWGLVENLDREDDHFLQDKVKEVRRAGTDRAALTRLAEHGDRMFVRVFLGDGGPPVESPGMADVLPWLRFPAEGRGAAEFEVGDGRTFRALTVKSPDSIVQVAMDTSHDEVILGEYRRQIGYVLGLSLLAAVGGGFWIARRGLRPLADVVATARRIGPAHLGERIAAGGLPTEVRDLADTFNHMLDRLEDAFARLGRFSADIAHELRTPVNNLRVGAEVALGRERTPEEYRDVLGSCLEECGRLTRLIDSLLFLARAEDPKTQLATAPVDVAEALRIVRDYYDAAAAEAGVTLALDAGPGLVVRADRILLKRAVGNLVSNALAHTPAGGTVTLFAAKANGRITVGVRDTGPGIPAEHLPYVFDRFYRADAARTATGRVGLGLAIVRGIAELHGGTAAAASPPGQGATVTLTLPEAG